MDDQDYHFIRGEVQKVKNYEWPRKQQDSWDSLSKFIYRTRFYNELHKKIKETQNRNQLDDNFGKYVICRWYNFWTSKIIEKYIFIKHQEVTEEENQFHKTIDFYIKNINFDLKCSVFPKMFRSGITAEIVKDSLENPSNLINWLYLKQSGEGRWHVSNRLFIIFVDLDNPENNWLLKRQFSRLKPLINEYIKNFNSDLFTIQNEKVQTNPFSDMLFFIKQKNKFKGFFYTWEKNKVKNINKLIVR